MCSNTHGHSTRVCFLVRVGRVPGCFKLLNWNGAMDYGIDYHKKVYKHVSIAVPPLLCLTHS